MPSPEKCWCEEELEPDRSGEYRLTDPGCYQCPLHGKDWRPEDAIRLAKLWFVCGEQMRDAVGGLLRAIDYQVRAEQENNSERAFAYQDLVRIEKEKAEAALAAYEEAQKEAAS